jgi:hypothetical protein
MRDMKNLQKLVEETKGMTPVQFEAYCETNGIQTEWLEVCVSDFNHGFYNVTLPDYEDANVFAGYGSAIKFQPN